MEWFSWWYPVYVVFGIFGLIVLFGSFFTVQTKTVAVVERFGKFLRLANAGLNIKIPFIDRVADVVDMQVTQLDVEVETKTKDNVFVKVVVAVQYYVLENKVYESYYLLSEPDRQIESFIFDVVRARVPSIDLDNVFENKDEIAQAVKNGLANTMDDFGYGIMGTFVTDIDPDPKVKSAMNEINEQSRLRVAATEKGEANRILQVKAAEAEAQSKALQGKGIADQRRAIIEGLRESVDAFKQSVEGATAKDVMALVLTTQYFDTLKEIGASDKAHTILLPHSPSAVGEIAGQIRNAMITANEVPLV